MLDGLPQRVADNIWPEPNSGCWLWGGYTNRKGYGQAGFRGRTRLVHREVKAIAVGAPIPDGIQVCHRCDNPSCCNPDHLFLGSAKDNSADCARKGRQASKLSALDAEAIRSAYEVGEKQRDIAKRFCVNYATISDVCRGKYWSHAGGRTDIDPNTRRAIGERHYCAKLSAAAAREIVMSHQRGESMRSIARSFGVGFSTVQRICAGVSWRSALVDELRRTGAIGGVK